MWTPLFNRLRCLYYHHALARSCSDLRNLERMFSARRDQLLTRQDRLLCKLWRTTLPLIATTDTSANSCAPNAKENSTSSPASSNFPPATNATP